MVSFVDRALITLIDPTAMTALLTAGAAGPYPRLQRLVDSVYQSEVVTTSGVTDVSTTSVQPVLRFDALETMSLTHTASQPAYALSELRGTRRRGGPSTYADLLASLSLQVTVARDAGGIDSVGFEPIEDIQSFADFQSRFQYLDLDGFLAEHRITTLEELRSRYEYLRGTIQLRKPTAAQLQPSTVTVTVSLACVLSEELDIMPALRAATGLRAAVDAADSGRTDALFGPPVHAAAVAVIFPSAALGAGVPTADQIDAVCAGLQILPLFASPP
ncbi:hypothetical protein GCM10011575_34900 [Microlunatus endophyticus]|uniref:Uncharacterized protein n=1 Tax=Microlunatus endophyticus TaxID=1716077 RepID=A0A917W7S1_9ACTN|nr:hypothetical protein [Microlunatus endophyticus]GGL73585.1 hypothetical protein GCM10011575_34900 [Microlunatus endophyticus]